MWEIVKAQGESYVDPHAEELGCIYVDDNGPSCMVGKYLINKLDIPADYFFESFGTDEMHSLKNYQEFHNIVGDMGAKFDLLFEPDARKLLSDMQSYQDTGNSWGVSFKSAVDPDFDTEDE